MQGNIERAAEAITREIGGITNEIIHAAAAAFNLKLTGETMENSLIEFIRLYGLSGQQKLVNIVVALYPGVRGATVTAILRDAFPGANISDRHGPHYLSLCRTGKRSGATAVVKPTASGRAPTTAPAVKAAPPVVVPDKQHANLVAAEAAVLDGPDTGKDITKLSRADLVALAVQLGLPGKGKTDEIMARITAFREQQTAAPAEVQAPVETEAAAQAV